MVPEYHTSVEGHVVFQTAVLESNRKLKKHKLLFERLVPLLDEAFFESVLIPLVEQTADVSLRVLDWLCINYSQVHNPLPVGPFPSLKNAYEIKLKRFHRPLFDAFRRKPETWLHFSYRKEWHTTTVAQLNFLQWCNAKGVFQYAVANGKAIKAHMEETNALNRDKAFETKKKRKPLTEERRAVFRVSTKRYKVTDEEGASSSEEEDGVEQDGLEV